MRNDHLLSLRRDRHHFLLGRLGSGLRLQDNDGLRARSLLLGRLRHENRLRLALHQRRLRLSENVILTGNAARDDVL